MNWDFQCHTSMLTALILIETRLDSAINDNMVQIVGCDIVRNDRSTNRGNFCIYLRNITNHEMKENLIPI